MTDDPVNPHYYKNFDSYAATVIIRRWNEIRSALGVEPVSFNVGNVLKYLQRAGLKSQNEVEDLKKAQWYLQSRIHELDPQNEQDPHSR